jgi:hypothetical protein
MGYGSSNTFVYWFRDVTRTSPFTRALDGLTQLSQRAASLVIVVWEHAAHVIVDLNLIRDDRLKDDSLERA